MKRSRFTAEKVIDALPEAAADSKTAELLSNITIGGDTLHLRPNMATLWVSRAKRMWALTEVNGSLNRLLADAILDNADLKYQLSKNGNVLRRVVARICFSSVAHTCKNIAGPAMITATE